MFVALEGIDRAGKETQGQKLFAHIRKLSKYNVVTFAHQPWRDYEIKRKLAEDKDSYSDGLQMADLYFGDREDIYKNVIWPNLEADGFVIQDRHDLSTFSYQHTQGVGLNKLLEMRERKVIAAPDITYLLDISAEESAARAERSGEPLEKFEKNSVFMRMNRSNYLKITTLAGMDERFRNVLGEIIIVNAMGNPDEIFVGIKNHFDILYAEMRR